MRAVLVFCEGNHDVVFVTRSLGAVAKCQWVDKVVKELPSPFGAVPNPNMPLRPRIQSFIVERYSGRTLGEQRLRNAQHPPAPAFQSIVTDQTNDILYVILRTGGDDAVDEVVKMLDLLRQTMVDAAGNTDVTDLAFAFLYDADTEGRATREANFRKAYSQCFPNIAAVSHGLWDRGARGRVGLYVFHDPAHPAQAGTLEDHLAPLVESHWPARWKDAETYVKAHEAGEPVSRKPAERLKATITLAGQPSFPGDPMSVVIDRHDKNRGLPATCFTGPASVELVTFLQSVPW